MWGLPGEPSALLHGHDASSLLEETLAGLPRPLVRRIKYYRAFVRTETLRLEGVFAPTALDGQSAELAGRLVRGYVDGAIDDVEDVGEGAAQRRPLVAAAPAQPSSSHASSAPSLGVELKIRVVAHARGERRQEQQQQQPTQPPRTTPPIPRGMQRFDASAFGQQPQSAANA